MCTFARRSGASCGASAQRSHPGVNAQTKPIGPQPPYVCSIEGFETFHPFSRVHTGRQTLDIHKAAMMQLGGTRPLARAIRCNSINVPEPMVTVQQRSVRVARNTTAAIAEAASPAAATSALPGGLPVGLAVAGGVALAAYGLKQVRCPAARTRLWPMRALLLRRRCTLGAWAPCTAAKLESMLCSKPSTFLDS